MNTMRTTASLFALAIAGSALLPTTASAQSRGENESRQNADSERNRERRATEGILVIRKRESGYKSESQSGGTFGEQRILDTPFSVTVIPQELLIDQQVRSLGDIARNDPSTIVITPPGFNDTINVRGYTSTTRRAIGARG